MVFIAYIFRNYLIFNFKDTKYLQDYQLSQIPSYPELANLIWHLLLDYALLDFNVMIYLNIFVWKFEK